MNAQSATHAQTMSPRTKLVQLLVINEVSTSVGEELCISAAKEQSKQDWLLSFDIMLFGFDSVDSNSYAQARSMLVSLSDASQNVVPVALVGLKADLGVSSDITSMVRAGLLWCPAALVCKWLD